VYVSIGRGSTVTPIATSTNTAGEPIEVGGGPGSGRGPGLIAITPDGKAAYVVIVGHPGAAVPIATATNTPGPPIEIGNHPDGIVITPDGKTVYVANVNSGTVTPIVTATNTAGEELAGHHHALDLVGALVDLGDLGTSVTGAVCLRTDRISVSCGDHVPGQLEPRPR
jgi:hypothetical protein